MISHADGTKLKRALISRYSYQCPESPRMTSCADQSPLTIAAHTTAQAQNRQSRYSLKYLQTAPNSGPQAARDSERHSALNSERRLLPGNPPHIGSQTAARSKHHLARAGKHHLRGPPVSVKYGSAIGIALYPAIQRLGDREKGVSCDTTVWRSGLSCIVGYYGLAIGKGGFAYNGSVIMR